MVQTPRVLNIALCLLLLAASSAVSAKDYLIEVVIFENRHGQDDSHTDLWFPKVTSALALGSDDAIVQDFLMVEDELTLTRSARKMDESGRYRVLQHMAWRQPGLDDETAKSIWINIGDRINMHLPKDINAYTDFIPATAEPTPTSSRRITSASVFGTIKVRLGRFLHMDTQLVYTDADRLQSYRLSQSRKMRSTELHFIDNPRFGILTRILPIDDDEPS